MITVGAKRFHFQQVFTGQVSLDWKPSKTTTYLCDVYLTHGDIIAVRAKNAVLHFFETREHDSDHARDVNVPPQVRDWSQRVTFVVRAIESVMQFVPTTSLFLSFRHRTPHHQTSPRS